MKRRPYPPVLIALVLATAGALYFFANRSPAPAPVLPREPSRTPAPVIVAGPVGNPQPGPTPASRPEPPATPVPASPAATGGGRRKPGTPLRIPAGQPIPEVFPHEKERDAIQSLAATYDARHIPEIAAFLDHPDPLVRAAACQGLVQLSSPEAVPVLRAAAAKARSEEEATALREAADFLSPAGSP